MSPKIGGHLPRWIYLAAIGAAGLVAMFVAHYQAEQLGIIAEVFRDIGIAAVTACILGLTMIDG